ncbi:HIT family protein [Giardia muris]|uniref:HIT family protein n=1 Tax=Giardia muris TaxID=5742 RepID=A0A4Z1SN14_GIAMU|nr:HIT family protein [Giardia muris]|eukprot:TNJ26225.1 HIT family protein [Giardia muris]
MAENCLFCKIARGEIPSKRVYAGPDVYAFMDINPVTRGHCLVIPRAHAVKLHELPSDAAASLGAALPKIAAAVCEATGASDYNVLNNNGMVAGQLVSHVHFHIIPRYSDDSYTHPFVPRAYETTQEEIGAVAELIAANVEK